MAKRYVRVTLKNATKSKPIVATLEAKDGVSIEDVVAEIKAKPLPSGYRIARLERIAEL